MTHGYNKKSTNTGSGMNFGRREEDVDVENNISMRMARRQRVELYDAKLTREQRLKNKLADHMMECERKGIACQFLRIFEPVKTTAQAKHAPDEFSFLCCHNKCGYFDSAECDQGFDCCHHVFKFLPSTKYANRALLFCCFKKAEFCNGPDSCERMPRICLDWSQYTNHSGLNNIDHYMVINTFFNNTIAKHFKQAH